MNVGVFDGVTVLLGVKVYVLVGAGVLVRVGGLGVLGNMNVGKGESARVGVNVLVPPVTGMEISVPVGVDVRSGAEIISEKATTVSAMTVLILETRKSTTPTVGVPIRAASLISLTPTAAALHSRLTPRTAATTTHMSGR